MNEPLRELRQLAIAAMMPDLVQATLHGKEDGSGGWEVLQQMMNLIDEDDVPGMLGWHRSVTFTLANLCIKSGALETELAGEWQTGDVPARRSAIMMLRCLKAADPKMANDVWAHTWANEDISDDAPTELTDAMLALTRHALLAG